MLSFLVFGIDAFQGDFISTVLELNWYLYIDSFGPLPISCYFLLHHSPRHSIEHDDSFDQETELVVGDINAVLRMICCLESSEN